MGLLLFCGMLLLIPRRSANKRRPQPPRLPNPPVVPEPDPLPPPAPELVTEVTEKEAEAAHDKGVAEGQATSAVNRLQEIGRIADPVERRKALVELMRKPR